MHSVPRRILPSRLLAILLALALFLTGCSSSDTGPGNTLRVVVASDPGSLNPWQYSSVVDRHILFNVYDHVTYLNLHDFSVEPEIAESWEMAPDGTAFTLKIRQGVRFHNGAPMTAADVAWSIEQARQPKASRTSGLLSAVSQVQTPDPATVRLVLSRPDRQLPQTLSDVLVAPKDFSDFNHPVGTGPFTFGDWQHGRQIVLNRNEDYWRDGLPHVDQVSFQVIADQSTALMQAQAGQADLIDQVSFAQLGQARRAGLTLAYPEEGASTGVYTLFLNTEKAPFDSEAVRQALSHAIDRPQIESFLTGVFASESNPVSPQSPNFAEDAPRYGRPNPAKAKELLAEAGHPDGIDAGEIVVYSNLGIDYIMAAQAVQQQAAKAGIRFTIRQADISSWSDQVISRHDFTAALGSVVPIPRDDDLIAHVFAKANGRISGLQNRDPQFFADIDLARTNLDDASYAEALKDLQRRAMTTQHVIVLGKRNIPVGHTSEVRGFVASPQQYLQLREVQLHRE